MGRMKIVSIFSRSGTTWTVTPSITGSARSPLARMWPEAGQKREVTATASSGPFPREPLKPACSLGPSICVSCSVLLFYPSNMLTSSDPVAPMAPQGKSLAVPLYPPQQSAQACQTVGPKGLNKYSLDEQKLCIYLCDSRHTLFSLDWLSFLNVPSVLKEAHLWLRAL